MNGSGYNRLSDDQRPLLHISESPRALCRFQAMKCAGWLTEFLVPAQLGEPAEWPPHRLYLRQIFLPITGLITSVGFFPASCGSEKFLLLKEQLTVIPASLSVQSSAIVDSPQL